MTTWKQYEGQAVDGIPLLQFLGGSDAGAVFAGELAGEPCAVKLVPADEAAAQTQMARWQQASKLSHPHITRIHQWGRARLGNVALVYLVMEYAEEVLSALDCPLTPKEAREMLTPAAKALTYLHSQRFAHGRVNPSNVLSVSEVLKIAGDSPLRQGERHASRPTRPYDPPELATSGVTAAGDIWSLGVTLVEAMTQEFPDCEADPPRLPESLKPDSFREVAAGCLKRDPAQRWTIGDITQWLERGTVPVPKKVKRNYLLPIGVAAGVVVAGLIAWPYIAGTSSTSSASTTAVNVAPSKPADSSPSASPPESAPAPPAPTPAVPVANTKAPEPKPQPESSSAKATSAKATSAKATSVKTASAKTVAAKPDGVDPAQAPDAPHQEVSPPPAPENLPPDVAQPVMPDVTAKARNTIHGKVPIVVRIEADAGGAVTDVKVESGGSSKYFADLAVKAAHQWKFVPGAAPRAWNVRFEFTHNAVAVQVTPTH